MADKKNQEGISQFTFFATVMLIFASMGMLLDAAGRPEDSWYRHFVGLYLTLMSGLFSGLMLWALLRQRKATAKGRPAEGGPGDQA